MTIKVEHLLKHQAYVPELKETGCLFVTSAIEAVDDRILEIFDKRHTRADFLRVVALFRETGLELNPTFVTFNPWITLSGYRDLLTVIRDHDLVRNVSPIQYAIRLLIPAGSRLLELPFVQEFVGTLRCGGARLALDASRPAHGPAATRGDGPGRESGRGPCRPLPDLRHASGN